MEEDFSYKDTILKIKCDRDIGDLVRESVVRKWQELESYIARNKDFRTSFEPVEIGKSAPHVARIMAGAAKMAGVGPMAAVAGTFSELIVKEAIREGVKWIIAENGGDICLYGDREFNLSVFAGGSPLSGKVGFSINPGKNTYGICTSSGTVGHSISLGGADAVTVFARSTPVADAFATAIANRVGSIEDGLGFAKKFIGKGIGGAQIIKGERVGRAGRLPGFFLSDG